jgi:hypothetical protein
MLAGAVSGCDGLIRDRTAFARGWLWIDGRRIYRVDRLGARMVAGPGDTRCR